MSQSRRFDDLRSRTRAVTVAPPLLSPVILRPMTPLERYQRDLTRPDFSEDAAQRLAVQRLDNLYHRLVAKKPRAAAWRGRLSRWFKGSQPPERGLYFWGGVGRGKTYLVDTFFECLPFDDKLRVHFHRFMQRVHQDLTALAGQKNPLEQVADRFAREARVICFDEFFVSDIGDAMLLAGLLGALFDRGVTLVATSNIPPEQLYKDGLQRARFLPAIALLGEHTEIINVDSGVDYRLRTLQQVALWHAPLDATAEATMTESFQALANGMEAKQEQLEINHRPVMAKRLIEGMAWFSFDELCNKPRSASDFIELARIFQTVYLEGVPVMTSEREDAARRFVNLVDEFYDRSVNLVVSAEAQPHALYQGSRLQFEFQRTLSRLQEMQSADYLALEHRP